jgi:anti-sigma-K factor RskA
MDLRQIEELLPFYALDALNDEEKELVEAYLKEHPEARQQVEEMGNAVSALPYAVPPVDPSPRSKEALMRRVAADQRAASTTRHQPSRPRGMRLGNIFQAFSMGAAIVAIVWAVILNTQLAQLRNEVSTLRKAVVPQANSLEQINQLRDEVSTLRKVVVAQANSLEQINQFVDQINAKLPQEIPSAVLTVSLKGTDIQPRAQGQLIVDPNSESAVLVIAGLDQLEAGKTYQVWLIDGGTPVSAGLLTVDENGQGVFIVTSEAAIGSFNALGISIEPEGGSPQPTGDIVVLSEL